MNDLKSVDIDIYNLINLEKKRQDEHIELIASENFVSKAVLEASGSVLTNKYAEGYSSKRYYNGCEYIDEIENLAISRVKQLFNAKFANVQPHSGSSANLAVYKALLNNGDKILGMSLNSGGHLTHGYKLSFSGRDYESYFYEVDPLTCLIDYDEVERLALEIKPKMIICGASAYPREIDFAKFRDIANKVGAYLFVDMAHIAGLCATGYHVNPLKYASVVSSTTHKTLRGPRGGIILTNDEEISKKIDKAVFPMTQGGPLMHIISAKAVAFKEALEPDYKEYIKNVVLNAKALADELITLGYKVLTNGTDNHIVLVDVYTKSNVNGKDAANILSEINITCNKNSIPNDTLPPMKASGIRLGSPAMTTKGYNEDDFRLIAHFIDDALMHKRELIDIKKDVLALTKAHPFNK